MLQTLNLIYSDLVTREIQYHNPFYPNPNSLETWVTVGTLL